MKISKINGRPAFAKFDFQWASCPFTENGLIRIMANPDYHPVKRHSVLEVISALKVFAGGTDHEFWPDDLTLHDPSSVDAGREGSSPLTQESIFPPFPAQSPRICA